MVNRAVNHSLSGAKVKLIGENGDSHSYTHARTHTHTLASQEKKSGSSTAETAIQSQTGSYLTY